MKNLAATVAILALSIAGITVVPSLARPLPRQAPATQQKKGPAVSGAAIVDGFYLDQLKPRVNLTDEQFDKIAPFLVRMLRERREITARRQKLLNQLQQITNPNPNPNQPKRDATDEELAQLTREFDQAETDRLTSQQTFLKSVDPVLNDRQRARLRVVLNNMEIQIQNILEDIKNANTPPKPPVPTTNPPANKNPNGPLH